MADNTDQYDKNGNRRRHVVFAITADFRNNARALKQFEVLLKLGYKITLVTFAPADSEVPDYISIIHVAQPAGGGISFFRSIHKLYKNVGLSIKADVYHASDLYVLPAMSAAAAKFKGKLIFDSRELYAHVASTAGRPWSRLAWHLVQKVYFKKVDLMFTVGESIAQKLAADYNVNPVVLYNAPAKLASDKIVSKSKLLHQTVGLPDETTILLHQGNIQKSRGCFQLIKAMHQVENAVLVFLGGGPLKTAAVEEVKKQHLSDKIRFLAPVPYQTLLQYTASADVGITLLEDTCLNHRFALPNKLFEYLMVGLPVLASNLPEISKVINNHHVGLTVDPQNISELASKMQLMADQKEKRQAWSKNAGKVFETYSWQSASNKMEAEIRMLFPATN